MKAASRQDGGETDGNRLQVGEVRLKTEGKSKYGSERRKRAVLGGETEERWVRVEYEKWTIMEKSAEEKERPGVTLGVKVQ